MAEKKCCVDNCDSSSLREEDYGVTYHKYPKDLALCNSWLTVTCHKVTNTQIPAYVCSRHFRKNDFKIYKDSKYILKSDAVPSIFPWNKSKNKKIVSMEKQDCEDNEESLDVEKVNNLCDGDKDLEAENLDAIKRFIENQEKAIQELKTEVEQAKAKDVKNEKENKKNKQNKTQDTNKTIVECLEDKKPDMKDKFENISMNINQEIKHEPVNVMNVILTDNELKHDTKKDIKPIFKQIVSGSGNNSMALSIGSKVEAKDFGGNWHPAEIAEVDYDEMEVLVHYQNVNKSDEWISVSSSRLRPFSSSQPNIPVSQVTAVVKVDSVIKEEERKEEERVKPTFTVGERCLARWKDSRRFMATITNDLGNGSYELVFDDGFYWKCSNSRLFKLKASIRSELSVDTAVPNAACTPSPVYPSGPMAPINNQIPPPAFHTHLFDPTRDYLGSKSERREMKRKLNIKEIFNIGQKKKRETKPGEKAVRKIAEKKPRVIKKEKALDSQTPLPLKQEIPDAVASIIGTLKNEPVVQLELKKDVEVVEVKLDESRLDIDESTASESTMDAADFITSNTVEHLSEVSDAKEKSEFESTDEAKAEEVIDKIKAVIDKLEDGLNQANGNQEKEAVTSETQCIEPKTETIALNEPKILGIHKKKLSKINKKKLRLIREKKVKKQVAKVKSELEAMKRQMEEMKKQMLAKTEVLASETKDKTEYVLGPGEWCCKWVNGQPVGKVSEVEGEVKMDAKNQPVLPRRSVEVEDRRLPSGWTKHMVRRSFGHSAGKWDVVLINPENRRFHTKNDMRNYLETVTDESLKQYEHALMDFGVHLKLARRIGWYNIPGENECPVQKVPVGLLACTSPLVKRKSLSLKKIQKAIEKSERKRKFGMKRKRKHKPDEAETTSLESNNLSGLPPAIPHFDSSTLEEGYVYVGLLKVQVIENLLRCPAEGCFKNFRNNTLLQMHIKHYHRELCKMMGSTPQVLDLAHARMKPTEAELAKLMGDVEPKTIKVKISKPIKKTEDSKADIALKADVPSDDTPQISTKMDVESIPRSPDSPKLRNALANKPIKRPRVLLPVRRAEVNEQSLSDVLNEVNTDFQEDSTFTDAPSDFDFEAAISTHTVTKPVIERKKQRRSLGSKIAVSEDDEWCGVPSDVETRSSFPGSGTPDSKITTDGKIEGIVPMSSESVEEQREAPKYMFTETGERVKIVHMKREEIINCHCGFREEDGLMVQCELCLCWQHALCHNIQHESQVPEKYTCSICLNPKRGRRSARFLHDQDRLYEGLLPGAAPDESLRRSHELSGNLLRIQDALHALRVKYHAATKKDHPKLYLWATDWESSELAQTQEKLNSDYSDLNVMISNIGKENMPVKNDLPIDIKTPPSEDLEAERFTQREGQLGSQALLSGLLASPGGVSLDLPISTSEIERLAKAVQEENVGPQPEAAIESGACRERLLRHVARCQAVLDARLDSIEAQVAELESQDPSFEDDETADYLPRTKQTIRMLMRDLDTMEELGVIT